MKKLTTEEFIKKAREIHGDKYDYSLVNYINCDTKVTILCPIHGEFEQIPYSHIRGVKCKKCATDLQISNTKKFIENSIKIHGNKYSYEKTEYKHSMNKVIITCPIHGDFLIKANAHLSGSGCYLCGREIIYNARRSDAEKFIKNSIEIHGTKYDYSNVNYINAETKVKIKCLIHGEFEQIPMSHLIGKGCYKCGKERLKDNLDDFIRKSKIIHGNKYDYSKTIYENSKKHVIIICPKHGEFKQIACDHVRGAGCKICNDSVGEKTIRAFLEENRIKFISQKKFKDCKHILELPFDFYLPEYNLCIEYDGEQHFKKIKFWGGEKKLQRTQKNDKIKTKYCKMNKIALLRISYKDNIIDILSKKFK